MKSNLFSLLLFLIPILTFSQTSNDKTVYLDSLWQETSEGNHQYYRVIKDYYSDKDSYKIYDYYKNGALQMEGISNAKDYLSRNGEFIYYYENGNKKQISNFVKSRLNGKEFQWYENGTKRMEGEYFANDKTYLSQLKINQFWDVNSIQKVIDGNGYYEEIYETFYAKGNIKNGFKDGVWEGVDKKIKCTFRETYADSKLISGVSIDSNNIEHNYIIAELQPIPKKGYEDFYKYIGKKFNISNEAYKNNISGKIILEFVVEKDGSVVDIKVKQGLGYGLDEEAIRVLDNYNKWMPGKYRGIDIRVMYSIPIKIKY